MEQEDFIEGSRRLRRPVRGLFCEHEQDEAQAYAATLEFSQMSRIKFDAGIRPMSESPLFGGDAQLGLW